ncbi:MAG: FG-GAP-like repeat-containing protein [Planctomycetota bacterium]
MNSDALVDVSRQKSAPSVEPPKAAAPTDEEKLQFISEVESSVRAFCSDCHTMPRPSSSSKEEWVDEVAQGYMLYEQSGRTDLAIPPQDAVLKYFQYQAPEKLVPPDSISGYPDLKLSFRTSITNHAGSNNARRRPPGITCIRWLDLGIERTNAIVYSDIGTGGIYANWPLEEDAPTKRLATLLQPVQFAPCDVDSDGLIDLVAADIGEFDANDTDLGRVVWLRQTGDSPVFEKHVIWEGISRVADVQPGDFDGDGDLDFMVGVFGWRQTGRIVMLRNDSQGDVTEDAFTPIEVDARHGAVNVTPCDLNQDGHLDFVALISQGYETVEAFFNDGSGVFRKQTIYSAPDPAYGSSGIQLVDFDQDDDLDVLMTNGDSFDRGPKPYHSVQWLENRGSFPFVHHHLCEMPGAMDATAGDFDGDGDMDVIAVALLAPSVADAFRPLDTSSVVLLKQTSEGKFDRYKIGETRYDALAVEAGDFDEDGKLDFSIGTFLRKSDASRPDLTIWWNEN